MNENVGNGGVLYCRSTAVVFAGDEPMAGNNVFWSTKRTKLGRVNGERVVNGAYQSPAPAQEFQF